MWIGERIANLSFNSTRCIRNLVSFRLSLVVLTSFNSTRCIRNGGVAMRDLKQEQLSTPHGALGTYTYICNDKSRVNAFNSTRCIRNINFMKEEGISSLTFQLHTVH